MQIDKNIALELSVLQMKYFGVIVAEKTNNKAKILANKNNNNIDSFTKFYNCDSLEITTIESDQFDKILMFLDTEEQILNLQSKIIREINDNTINNQTSSIMELIKLILQEAITKRASDIHFEQYRNTVKIRFRIDGMLIERFDITKELFSPLSIKLKLLSHLDITENISPQDGRFSMELKRNDAVTSLFDFRISTLPLIDGESIVLRILDKNKTILELDSLGFSDKQLDDLEHLYSLPYGLVLITGPTGSGKSTTLYGILNIIRNKNIKIITLEDPVEYKLDGISQVAINNKISFNSILRNVLRQDPDVIMIGEVRDKETLKLAIQAAFTGHLVFATLHTNNSLDTILRLMDLGLEPYFISQALSGIISQRLLRKLCSCKIHQNGKFIKNGCEICNFTGYSNREAIAEIMINDELLDKFINGNINKLEMIEAIKSKNKNFFLLEQALLKADLGITDKDEVYRVVKCASQ